MMFHATKRSHIETILWNTRILNPSRHQVSTIEVVVHSLGYCRRIARMSMSRQPAFIHTFSRKHRRSFGFPVRSWMMYLTVPPSSG